LENKRGNNMKHLRFIIISIILLSFIALAGCTEKDVATKSTDIKVVGFIIEVEKNRILIAEDITLEKFEEIKDKSITELYEEGISLIYLSFNDVVTKLKKGNQVEAWISSGIEQSYPGQAETNRIEVKD
jgi:hypothetical protein